MATQPPRSGSDAPAASVPFSYAQAAKGASNTRPSPAAAPKPSSVTVTSSEDATLTPSAAHTASVPSWADDAEAESSRSEKQSSAREDSTRANPAPPKQSSAPSQPTASSISSPDLGASSSSTVVKDDDDASLQNASSESTSTWENKSQASTSVEKATEAIEQTSEKVKGKKMDKVSFKPLQEAPIPSVNPWARRADELKAKVAQKVTTAKPTTTGPALPNGTPQGPSVPANKKSKGVAGSDNAETKETAPSTETRPKGREDEKVVPPRKDAKPDADSDRTKKGPKGRQVEKEAKPTATVLPPPPTRDQQSWPTPESAVDEDRKKSQEKGERNEKEHKDSASSRPHGKQEWVTVPYTPNVIFNTPLPNTATSRRGGRGAGRGGPQGSARSSGPVANGVGSPEKDAATPGTLPNGDQPRRGRPDVSVARDASPKNKRTGSVGSTTLKDNKSPALPGEKASKATTAPEVELPARRTSAMTEPLPGSPAASQSNTFPRQYPQGRSNKSRRGDFAPQGDRRKDSDAISPTKEGAGSYDRRVSSTTQTDVPDEGDRRSSAYQDGQNGLSKSGSYDRRSSTFSGRERGRGGPRGGRVPFQNGHHQFPNGHGSTSHPPTFPLRSPNTFHPDQGAYFPAPPTPGRNYRNGPRSQSVTTDNMYGRVPGYPAGPQQIAPIQTYMGSMYDFQMMHPMSAMPYSPYGVDQVTLFSMVTTQLEYYFSVENLCKDIFLRKHMDSKGFVYLSVVAGFNRIKQLTTDMELIKYVCYQSRVIDFRIGHDGKERLRPREGWEQWVLAMSERDPSAQNDGPGELHNPPIPHPSGFEQGAPPLYPGMSAVSPTGPASFNTMNGVRPMAPRNSSATPPENVPNGQATDGINGFAGTKDHPTETSTKAVSAEPDSFSDDQVETLSVIVRRQEQSQQPTLPPSATRTFSNGSIDSKSGVPDEPERMNGRLPTPKINGTGPLQGFESKAHGGPRRTLSPFTRSPSPAITPVRLYWVKGKDAPVESIPIDSTYESYTHLRFKALEQRLGASPGTCPYDMDVLYQFWSHFLIRNFNLHMYQEFRHFAFEDSAHGMSDIGLTNLIKFYGESLLSPQNLIRDNVARDYVELVKSENKNNRPAFKQLRAALRNGALDPRNRKRIGGYLDSELRTSLE